MTTHRPFFEQGHRDWFLSHTVLHDLTPQEEGGLSELERQFVELFRNQPPHHQWATVRRDSGEQAGDASVLQKFIAHFKANLTPEPTV